MEYLMNQVSANQMANQSHNITAVGQGTGGTLNTKDNKCQDLEVPAFSIAPSNMPSYLLRKKSVQDYEICGGVSSAVMTICINVQTKMSLKGI